MKQVGEMSETNGALIYDSLGRQLLCLTVQR